ncbi:hypothetical protein DUNSADRAFT_5390 [Dunaliella salina]|uniref:Uncharacterized protein n=1 Tax=Dunaliella salina TaxID=3046 RepID=A0ABQ7GQD4_DUNSA|nr:hypothetical protein DUNSADRAFT_5390 [Dunaliella salina]|eukprot:KAF5836811.1 hypothetical protein DUNSADRAFT_5390 [Dunaliella salina]
MLPQRRGRCSFFHEMVQLISRGGRGSILGKLVSSSIPLQKETHFYLSGPYRISASSLAGGVWYVCIKTRGR